MVSNRLASLLAIILIFASACSVEHHHHGAGAIGPPASPSTEVGAGGGGVMCKDASGKMTSFEVLEVYEARVRGMHVSLGADALSVEEKIEVALSRLRRLSPKRAQEYATRAREILAQAHFFRQGYLPRVGDEDPTDLPEGCRLVQIATRRKPIFAGDREFLFDGTLYDLLDRNNRAALLLHEVAYEEGGKRFGHRSSRFSRAFVSIFITPHIEPMTTRGFFDFLHTVEFKATDYGGITVPTHATSGSDNTPGRTVFDGDRISRAIYNVEFVQGDYSVPTQDLDYFGRSLWLGGNLSMEAWFSAAGRLIGLQGGIGGKDRTPLPDRGNTIHFDRGARPPTDGFFTAFHDDGRFELVTVGAGTIVRTRGAGASETLSGLSCVALEEDGRARIVGVGRGCSQSDWAGRRRR